MKEKARLEWLEKIARMERVDLIDAYEKEGTLRHSLALQVAKLDQKVRALQSENSALANQRERRKTFIAASTQEASFAASRMGLNPNRVTLVSTDDLHSDIKLRGYSLDPTDVYFVRGYKRGLHYKNVLSALAPCLRRADGTPVGLDCIAYAPDPHFDMHENNNWRGASEFLSGEHAKGIRYDSHRP